MPNKVNANIYVFFALILHNNRVQVYEIEVVTIENGDIGVREIELVAKITNQVVLITIFTILWYSTLTLDIEITHYT